MSDCSMGGRRAYNAPTHTPDEDALTITAHFKDGSERPCTMNRMGRTLDYLESDGERYERVSECEIECDWHYMEEVLPFTHEDTWAYRCGACGWSFRYDRGIKPDYCPHCGARVKEVGE